MKKILTILFLSSLTISYAQVGIGTNAPKASLDVMARPASANIVDGIKHQTSQAMSYKQKTHCMEVNKMVLLYM